MYFADLLISIDKGLCIQEFLKKCDDASDINRLIDALNQAIENMKHLIPVYSLTATIQIGHVEDQSETYDYAYLIEDGDDEREYSFEIVPWAEVLGYRIEDKELENYEPEYYASLVLWEMTWFGYDEETIQRRWKELND